MKLIKKLRNRIVCTIGWILDIQDPWWYYTYEWVDDENEME